MGVRCKTESGFRIKVGNIPMGNIHPVCFLNVSGIAYRRNSLLCSLVLIEESSIMEMAGADVNIKPVICLNLINT